MGFFFPPAFIAAGLTGMGSIFMHMQETNHRVQEKIQRETHTGAKNDVKSRISWRWALRATAPIRQAAITRTTFDTIIAKSVISLWP